MEQFKVAFAQRGNILEDKALKAFTTWKVGGKAQIIYLPFELADLQDAIRYIHQHNIPFRIIGRGSNLLVADRDFAGIIIILSKMNNKIEQQSTNRFIVGAGFGMQQLSRYLAKNFYKGHEFFSGIPGSIGGGIVMNAGTPDGEMEDVLVRAQVITPEGDLIWMGPEELAFKYRSSFIKHHPDYTIVAGDFYFELEDESERGNSMQVVKDHKTARRLKQPLSSPSCGSVFQNPAVGYSGQYIEAAGLKGYEIGGAQVSLMHANFIINTGTATAQNLHDLIRHIQETILEKDGVALETEVELFNFKE